MHQVAVDNNLLPHKLIGITIPHAAHGESVNSPKAIGLNNRKMNRVHVVFAAVSPKGMMFIFKRNKSV